MNGPFQNLIHVSLPVDLLQYRNEREIARWMLEWPDVPVTSHYFRVSGQLVRKSYTVAVSSRSSHFR